MKIHSRAMTLIGIVLCYTSSPFVHGMEAEKVSPAAALSAGLSRLALTEQRRAEAEELLFEPAADTRESLEDKTQNNTGFECEQSQGLSPAWVSRARHCGTRMFYEWDEAACLSDRFKSPDRETIEMLLKQLDSSRKEFALFGRRVSYPELTDQLNAAFPSRYVDGDDLSDKFTATTPAQERIRVLTDHVCTAPQVQKSEHDPVKLAEELKKLEAEKLEIHRKLGWDGKSVVLQPSEKIQLLNRLSVVDTRIWYHLHQPSGLATLKDARFDALGRLVEEDCPLYGPGGDIPFENDTKSENIRPATQVIAPGTAADEFKQQGSINLTALFKAGEQAFSPRAAQSSVSRRSPLFLWPELAERAKQISASLSRISESDMQAIHTACERLLGHT